jgi:hypothetical protein
MRLAESSPRRNEKQPRETSEMIATGDLAGTSLPKVTPHGGLDNSTSGGISSDYGNVKQIVATQAAGALCGLMRERTGNG